MESDACGVAGGGAAGRVRNGRGAGERATPLGMGGARAAAAGSACYGISSRTLGRLPWDAASPSAVDDRLRRKEFSKVLWLR